MKHFYLLTLFVLFMSCAFAQQYPVPVYSAQSKRPSQSGRDITKALDGDLATIYNTQFYVNSIPDTIDFVFLNAKSINKIVYTPRTDHLNGVWSNVEVYHSTLSNPQTFVKDKEVLMAEDATVKTIDLSATPINQPYQVRLVIKAGYAGFSTAAEINFYSAEPGSGAPGASECDLPTAEFSGLAVTKLTAGSATASGTSPYSGVANTYDGSVSTYYRSNLNTTVLPIDLTFNFDNAQQIDYLVYTPRVNQTIGAAGIVEILYYNASNTLVSLMEFDCGLKSTPSQINFPSQINTSRLVFRFKTAGKNGALDAANCAEMEFYRKGGSSVNLYPNIFNSLHDGLKPGITQSDINGITSPFFKGLAQCLFNNTYNKKFRVQNVIAYPTLSTVTSALKTMTVSSVENPTGILFGENTTAVIFVGPTNGFPLTFSVRDWSSEENMNNKVYALNEGVNFVQITGKGLGYINYYTDQPGSQPIAVHIATGIVNGYYDPTTDSDADWLSNLTNNVYPKYDIKGKYVSLNMNKSSLLKKSPYSGADLIATYDKILETEYVLMGLFKYNRVPKNHLLGYIQSIGGYNANSLGAHFSENSNGDGLNNRAEVLESPWLQAHEFGHINQVRPGMKWHGATEVTNNMYSAYIEYTMGTTYKNATRLEKQRPSSESLKALYPLVAGTMFNGHINGCMIYGQTPYANGHDQRMLIPLWQLELYYQFAGASKNLPTLPQRLAGTPAPGGGQVDVAYWLGDLLEKTRTTDYSGYTDGQIILKFVENTCDVVKEDLTDFFKKSGYLVPLDSLIDDYGVKQVTVTPEQIATTIANIKAKNYPQPVAGALKYISANSVAFFKDKLAVTGDAGVGTTLNTNADPSLTTVTISADAWKNVVAFETYQQTTLKDVAIYGTADTTLQTTVVRFPGWATSIYAVGYDGTRKLVYPAVDAYPTLPVGLLGFTASATASGALLQWKTSSEQNNKAFEIYKSDDGKTFNKIGEIAGKGTTAHVSNYQFVDTSFVKSVYYKLVQVDADGKAMSYDDQIKYVKGLADADDMLYPNPATVSVYIKGNAGAGSRLVKLLDVSGKVVKTQNITGPNAEINVSQLKSGIYIVQIIGKNGTEIKKLIKK